MTRPEPGALAGVRVVDLAGPYGNYCGKMLADLGADVVLVEPPDGAESRSRTPRTADGESLWFTYHNANKRGVVIDPQTGGATLAALAGSASVLIGSGPASWPARWGLDLEGLTRDCPQLVVTSITPFGLDGPYADHDATDIVCLALGGLLALGGYGDGKPLQTAGEQALTAASSFAAVGTMLALLHAEASGQGQSVDVSAQECVSMALEHAIQYYDLVGTVRGRQTGRQRSAGAGIYRCADGWIYLFVGGIASGRFWVRFVDWLQDEGAHGAEELATPEWQERAYFETPGAKEIFLRVFERFTADRGKENLYHDAQSRGIPLTPVRQPSEVAESDQLRRRDYFQPLTSAGGRDILAPGAPYALAATPWRQRRRAPVPGEHTAEVMAEWGAVRNA